MAAYDFKGKTVWITGASSGIGEALSYEFAKRKAHLIISARRADRLDLVKAICEKMTDVSVIQMDITNEESIRRAVEESEKSDRLDLLIHNAGVAQKGLVNENHMDTERQVMETNYFGTVALTKAVIPRFAGQKYGWYAVVTSIAGIIGVPGRSIYSASKHALHGFFESLRAEVFPSNIKVSIIMPGFIATQITLKELRGDGSAYGKMEKSHQLGMKPHICARKIIRGLERRKKNIVVGGFEITGVYMQRFLPRVYDFLIRQHPMKRWRNLKRGLGFR